MKRLDSTALVVCILEQISSVLSHSPDYHLSFSFSIEFSKITHWHCASFSKTKRLCLFNLRCTLCKMLMLLIHSLLPKLATESIICIRNDLSFSLMTRPLSIFLTFFILFAYNYFFSCVFELNPNIIYYHLFNC